MTQAVCLLDEVIPYLDERYGAIFELAGDATGLPALGLATCIVRPGATSPAHYHLRMAETYLILAGNGVMRLGDLAVAVSPGHCISIPPGVVHSITAAAEDPLHFVVATSPAYDPDDDIEVE